MAAAAPISGGGRGGFWRSPPEVDVDFRRFTAAVRAILLFEGADDFHGVPGRIRRGVCVMRSRSWPTTTNGTKYVFTCPKAGGVIRWWTPTGRLLRTPVRFDPPPTPTKNVLV